MKILLTGASGLLGRALMREIENWGEPEVIGTAFNRVRDGLSKLDLLDAEAVSEFIRDARPDVVIHSAAERRPDVSEADPEGTCALNVGATETVVRSAKEVGAWVLFMSTNYVFDGSTPPYSPDSETHPLNLYGETKLKGERAVLEESNASIVLRLPTLYGQVESLSECSVTTIAEQIQEGTRKFDHWATRFPTFVDDVASVCRQILAHKAGHDGICGIYHWSSDEALTKYEMARVISAVWGVAEEDLEPDPYPPSGAARPKNCQLDCRDLFNLGIKSQTPFEVGIYRTLEPFREGSRAR